MEKVIVPPGQRVIDELPVLQYSHIPKIDISNWKLTLKGLVEGELQLSFEDITRMEKTELALPFHCVTGWSNLTTKWGGILFKSLVERFPLKAGARFAYITCFDNYSTNLPIEVLCEPNVILAYELNGRPLPSQHGYPLRLVVPGRYAYKSAKWLRDIWFLEQDKKGFWEQRGYSNSADPYKEERYSP